MSENNGSTGNKKFLKGTLILTASSMVVKVIGSVNWIILSRILGGEGIGLYQMGFPIYLMAITVSSAGIPVAISIITAEKVAENDFFGAKGCLTYRCGCFLSAAWCFRRRCGSAQAGLSKTTGFAMPELIIPLSRWRRQYFL